MMKSESQEKELVSKVISITEDYQKQMRILSEKIGKVNPALAGSIATNAESLEWIIFGLKNHKI